MSAVAGAGARAPAQPERDTPMQRLSRGYDRLLTGLAGISALILAAITLVIPINAGLRSAGMPVIYGALDAVEYGILAATFLAAPWVLAQNAHVRVDLVTQVLPERAARVLNWLMHLLGLATCLWLGWAGLEALVASHGRGAMIRTAFVVPEWWSLVPLPMSMLLCALHFLRGLVAPLDRPTKTPHSGL